MIFERKIDRAGRWLFDDGKNPVQLRVMETKDVKKEPHYHKTMHEYYIMLTGHLDLWVEGHLQYMRSGDVMIVEPGEVHYIDYISDHTVFMLLMPPPVPDDKVTMEIEEVKKKYRIKFEDE